MNFTNISSISSSEIAILAMGIAIQSVLVGFLWLYPIIECSMHHPKGKTKDRWVLFITAVPLLGGLAYLVLGRPVVHPANPNKEKELSNPSAISHP